EWQAAPRSAERRGRPVRLPGHALGRPPEDGSEHRARPSHRSGRNGHRPGEDHLYLRATDEAPRLPRGDVQLLRFRQGDPALTATSAHEVTTRSGVTPRGAARRLPAKAG